MFASITSVAKLNLLFILCEKEQQHYDLAKKHHNLFQLTYTIRLEHYILLKTFIGFLKCTEHTTSYYENGKADKLIMTSNFPIDHHFYIVYLFCNSPIFALFIWTNTSKKHQKQCGVRLFYFALNIIANVSKRTNVNKNIFLFTFIKHFTYFSEKTTAVVALFANKRLKCLCRQGDRDGKINKVHSINVMLVLYILYL